MKKFLLVFSLSCILGISSSFAQASCTPDFTCLGSAPQGICPDSATGIPPASISIPYNTTVSVKIPSSIVYSGTTYNLSHFGITSVLIDTTTGSTGTYVPLSAIGLSYLGNGSNTPSGASGITSYTMTNYCYWSAPGGACVIVSGTPNKAGVFPVKITSDVRAVVFGVGGWIPAPDNTDYKLIVNNAAGIETLDMNKFDVKQNMPNPFSGSTEIQFSSVAPETIEFRVFNMLGSVVYSKTIKADKGVNTITLDASAFPEGIYMYSLKNGNKTITKRMIVTK